jgi:hypothetical protein
VPSSVGPLSSTVTRHPLPSDGTATVGPCETSSSGETVTGGPVAGLEHPLPLAGPRQRGPTRLGPPLPPAGPQ